MERFAGLECQPCGGGVLTRAQALTCGITASGLQHRLWPGGSGAGCCRASTPGFIVPRARRAG